MLSYAQNFEDVMLARALRDVTSGFYVDVGAWDPNIESVTLHFYLQGWSGVNIEPLPDKAEALRVARPRDTTLELAAGRAGVPQTRICAFEGSGLSTSNATFAARAAKMGFPQKELLVETKPLNEIFETFAPAEAHFLKIDCEGAEEDVLLGLDLRRFRPWIVLVEATEPMSQIPSWEKWEPLLLSAGYNFVYFDGLNRFYLAAEQASRAQAFSYGPCLFDGFVLAKDHFARRALQAQIAELKATIATVAPVFWPDLPD